MYTRISDLIGVESDKLDEHGVFDAFAYIDAELYVDPPLLASSSHAEMRNAHSDLQHHFNNILRLIRQNPRPGGPLWIQGCKMLLFPENPSAKLGLAKEGAAGRGIGPDLADKVFRTAYDIVQAGYDDPTIFELVPLFRNNIGPDRLSDMALHLTHHRFLEFTERIAHELHTSTTTLEYRDREYQVLSGTGDLLLVPKDVLRDIPIAKDWSDVDVICTENAEVRERVNKDIGNTWKQATRDIKKEELFRILRKNPEALGDLLSQYKAKDKRPYDFENDPNLKFRWVDVAQEAINLFPLELEPAKDKSPEELSRIAQAIISHFRKLVENNGLNEVLRGQKESAAQRLFFGIADAYCQANDLDVSPEPNAGRGPVDFKFSQGSAAKVLVEVKLTSNSKASAWL
jgi:hypothetical protein